MLKISKEVAAVVRNEYNEVFYKKKRDLSNNSDTE